MPCFVVRSLFLAHSKNGLVEEKGRNRIINRGEERKIVLAQRNAFRSKENEKRNARKRRVGRRETIRAIDSK